MNNLWRLFSNVKGYYSEINSATLTGAIDVVVVRQEDGSFVSSPFHVRFGKMGVLRSREKIVDVEINGEPAPIHMKLGEAGEAFFVEESDEAPPEHLACSPIPSVDDMIKSGIEKMKKEAEKNEQEVLEKLNAPGDPSDTANDGKDEEIENEPTNLGSDNVEKEDKENVVDDVENEPSNSEMESATSQINIADDDPGLLKTDSDQGDDTVTFQLNNMTQTPSEGSMEQTLQEVTSEDVSVSLASKMSRSEGSEHSTNISYQADSEVSERKDTEDSLILEECMDFDRRRHSVDNLEEDVDMNDQLDAGSESVKSQGIPIPNGGRARNIENSLDSDDFWSLHPHREFYPFSDQDTPLTTPLSQSPKHSRSSPHKFLSDTEIDIKHTKEHREEATNKDEMTWSWGQLPEGHSNHHRKEKKSVEAQDDKDQEDEFERKGETKTIRVRRHHHHHHHHHHHRHHGPSKAHKVKEEGMYLDDLASADAEVAALYLHRQSSSPSGSQEEVESGLGHSLPVSPASHEGKDTSHCEEIDDIAMSLCGDLRYGKVSAEKFAAHIVSFEDFSSNPNGILNNPQLVVRIDKRYYNWQVAAPLLMSYLVYRSSFKEDTFKNLKRQFMPKPDKRRGYSWFSWRAANYEEGSGSSEDDLMDMEKPRHRTVTATKSEPDFLSSDDNLDIAYTEQLIEEELGEDEQHKNYRKTTRLTSEQLVMLGLKSGPNSVTFSVTTKYQGTAQCSATIYLWDYDDRVVISDIDGTITKSDVLGHILPVIGGQWAQSGVATLFSSIKENGYQFLYLTARAIGQARQTREYLKSVKQDQITLPDGPVLMSPSSLITAFHREVIEKKPEEFKIQCLRDIQTVFPKNPFYAGFGNKINDVWSYRAVGIPVSRIFTINHKGEVRYELTNTFQSSYIHLRDVVDQMFPPLKLLTNEYNSFMYWRLPLPTVDVDSIETEDNTEQTKPTTTQ